MSYLDEDQAAEHECPTALERPASDFSEGGMFWSPAGRWETVTDTAGRSDYSPMVTVHTDRCTWQFWRSDKHPYIDGWKLNRDRHVLVNEGVSHLEVVVASRPGYGSRGHVLASARQVRGTGWEITDRPDPVGDVEQITMGSKAKARAEMNRRARAHAKRIGIKVWQPSSQDGAR